MQRFPHFVVFFCLITLSGSMAAEGVDRNQFPTNRTAASVRDSRGQRIDYDRPTLEKVNRSQQLSGSPQPTNAWPTKKISWSRPSSLKAAIAESAQPLWQYATWGSNIGAGNIVVCPTTNPGDAPEIILGGNSVGDFNGDDFWQVVRWNSNTGSYDQLFVSPIYHNSYSVFPAAITRITLGNLTGDATPEIVVMLEDGRIFVYDLQTKSEIGYLETGIFGFEGLTLADVNGDGYADLIITTPYDLFVADGTTGDLLFWVANGGGWDVVAGQMDSDPSLEIVTTNGAVVDVASQTLQWVKSDGFGYRLKLAPLPGQNYQQLIAADAWNYIRSYDVENQLPLWTMQNENTNAIEVADINNDGVPELLVGDAQSGTVHVHDLATQAKLWELNDPEPGVTNIAVADIDGDGVVEVLWGAGYYSTGPDYLYAGDIVTHAIKSRSIAVGTFFGPVIGDLDGDGQPELVFCANVSDGGYNSGRIFVFDLATLTLRGISPRMLGSTAFDGVTDLKLRDVDGDGRMEILIAASGYNGLIEIYGFDSSNTFTLKWTNPTQPLYAFDHVEAADLNGDGSTQIIATHDSGYVYIFDYGSQNAPWQSASLSTTPVSLVVRDLDGDGRKEIVVLTFNDGSFYKGDLYTFDGPTRELRSLVQATGYTSLANQDTGPGLIANDHNGVAHFLSYVNNSYSENFVRQLGWSDLNGLNVSSDARLWTGRDSILNFRAPTAYDTQQWQSPIVTPQFGGFVAVDPRPDRQVVYSSGPRQVAALAVGPNPSYWVDAFAINGTITKSPDQSQYVAGTRLSLTAVPDPGYKFAHWSGDVPAYPANLADSITVTMDSNLHVTANFEARRYRVTAQAIHGSVTKDPDNYDYGYGDEVTLTAVPDPGYQFTGWSGDASGTTNPLVVTVDADKSILANFLPPAATPTISPNSGTFKKKVFVVMSCATPGASIYYTLDGTDPTAASTVYVAGKKNKGFKLIGTGTHTVKAKAIASGYADSDVATATLTIN